MKIDPIDPFNSPCGPSSLRNDKKRFPFQFRAADFEHYCRFPGWTIDQAVALSFGKDPQYVNWLSMAAMLDESRFARLYGHRRDLFLSAVAANQLKFPVRPPDFVDWAKKHEIELPARLIECVALRPHDVTGDANEISRLKRMQTTNEIMIIAMAIKAFGYFPGIKTGAAKKILQAVEEVGLTLSDDTILDRLRLAEQLVDPEHLPRQ